MVGGISLMWKDNTSNPYNLSVLYIFDRFMACNISNLSMNCSFVAIFLYTPPSHALRFF